MAALLLLCGLPGAGKSTFARAIADAASRTYEVRCISFDDVFAAHFAADGGSFAPQQWKAAVAAIYTEVESALAAASTSGKTHILLLDDNMYYRSMRKKSCSCVDSPDLCRARNAARQSPVPDVVFRRMHALFEPPSPSMHPWEARSIVVDLSSADAMPAALHAALAMIAEAVATPEVDTTQEIVLEKERSRAATLASVLHRADLVLRQLVGQILRDAKESNKASLPALAKHLSAVKEAVLREYARDTRDNDDDIVDGLVAAFLRQYDALADVTPSTSTTELTQLVELASGLTHEVLRFRLTLVDGTSVDLRTGRSATMATLLRMMQREIATTTRSLSWRSVLKAYELRCNGAPLRAPTKQAALSMYPMRRREKR
ncbi:hypothetical protein SPRG_22201 [Saprolegnia parasitica CBS 223.65]|uniref:Uncharacterized protein n=1 Tax=Saprolegnia parasitica (strain CBS 223.65) TaxID=695850 RepID=A0A067CKH5_SAPPC|nr:hypothetical protein SPRG_22201 [Saprolegnia parasitica CBS 223.65]KDO27292.1 hypothetical protein SPRG_22201 [Saprolegnia parasitica CBS 223.65]|eukprot:XP_012202119.1 hypothetical protein SPRG_22201 [Saprolegnia parasitica CBS 223.65]